MEQSNQSSMKMDEFNVSYENTNKINFDFNADTEGSIKIKRPTVKIEGSLKSENDIHQWRLKVVLVVSDYSIKLMFKKGTLVTAVHPLPPKTNADFNFIKVRLDNDGGLLINNIENKLKFSTNDTIPDILLKRTHYKNLKRIIYNETVKGWLLATKNTTNKTITLRSFSWKQNFQIINFDDRHFDIDFIHFESPNIDKVANKLTATVIHQLEYSLYLDEVTSSVWWPKIENVPPKVIKCPKYADNQENNTMVQPHFLQPCNLKESISNSRKVNNVNHQRNKKYNIDYIHRQRSKRDASPSNDVNINQIRRFRALAPIKSLNKLNVLPNERILSERYEFPTCNPNKFENKLEPLLKFKSELKRNTYKWQQFEQMTTQLTENPHFLEGTGDLSFSSFHSKPQINKYLSTKVQRNRSTSKSFDNEGKQLTPNSSSRSRSRRGRRGGSRKAKGDRSNQRPQTAPLPHTKNGRRGRPQYREEMNYCMKPKHPDPNYPGNAAPLPHIKNGERGRPLYRGEMNYCMKPKHPDPKYPGNTEEIVYNFIPRNPMTTQPFYNPQSTSKRLTKQKQLLPNRNRNRRNKNTKRPNSAPNDQNDKFTDVNAQKLGLDRDFYIYDNEY